MPTRPARICGQAGCSELVYDGSGRCEKHRRQTRREQDERRGSAHERGYTARWQKYRAWFLRQPGNQICKLRVDGGCALVAQCVDHIDPPDGPDDPRFWDYNNHQASCIHCNSVKGRRKIVGTEWRV